MAVLYAVLPQMVSQLHASPSAYARSAVPRLDKSRLERSRKRIEMSISRVRVADSDHPRDKVPSIEDMDEVTGSVARIAGEVTGKAIEAVEGARRKRDQAEVQTPWGFTLRGPSMLIAVLLVLLIALEVYRIWHK